MNLSELSKDVTKDELNYSFHYLLLKALLECKKENADLSELSRDVIRDKLNYLFPLFCIKVFTECEKVFHEYFDVIMKKIKILYKIDFPTFIYQKKYLDFIRYSDKLLKEIIRSNFHFIDINEKFNNKSLTEIRDIFENKSEVFLMNETKQFESKDNILQFGIFADELIEDISEIFSDIVLMLELADLGVVNKTVKPKAKNIEKKRKLAYAWIYGTINIYNKPESVRFYLDDERAKIYNDEKYMQVKRLSENLLKDIYFVNIDEEVKKNLKIK